MHIETRWLHMYLPVYERTKKDINTIISELFVGFLIVSLFILENERWFDEREIERNEWMCNMNEYEGLWRMIYTLYKQSVCLWAVYNAVTK